MQYSNTALLVFAALDLKLIKSNANFWTKYSDPISFNKLIEEREEIKSRAQELKQTYLDKYPDIKLICAFDSYFPLLNPNMTRASEKPFLLFCKGDIDLLSNLNNNVAVIGHQKPSDATSAREAVIVNKLVEDGLVVVSGLARGCDTLAHRATIDSNGKTIAILPSPIQDIFPSENTQLANLIVERGGLLVSEYYKDASNRYESINRLVTRDRLQALFAKAMILVASPRKEDGDCGSRHGMRHAKDYKIKRYVMFNEQTDTQDITFGLNLDLLKEDKDIKILTNKSINEIKDIRIDTLDQTQQTLF